MQLRTSPLSPFGRKVVVAATCLGLGDQLELTPADFRDANDPLRVENPLGKMPVLTLDDGSTLYDSPVIVEYLNSLGDHQLIPPTGASRWEALRFQALADGLMDAGVAIQMEKNLRPVEKQHPDWLDFQRGKLERGFAALASNPPSVEPITIGAISVACLLEWIDFRQQMDWRAAQPNLSEWLERFNGAVPFFAQTRPA